MKQLTQLCPLLPCGWLRWHHWTTHQTATSWGPGPRSELCHCGSRPSCWHSHLSPHGPAWKETGGRRAITNNWMAAIVSSTNLHPEHKNPSWSINYSQIHMVQLNHINRTAEQNWTSCTALGWPGWPRRALIRMWSSWSKSMYTELRTKLRTYKKIISGAVKGLKCWSLISIPKLDITCQHMA